MRSTTILSVLLVFLGAGSARAEVVDFTENFSGTLLKDQSATTAVWDTLSGSIHLTAVGLSPLGSLNTAGNGYATALSSGYIFMADGTGGLLSFSADENETISSVDFKVASDQVRAIAIQGNWAFLAIGSSGLQSFDVSDPVNMVASGTADPAGSGFASGVAVSGSYAYLANSAEGIAVMEIASPASPQFTATVPTNNWARNVSISGSNLFVADGNAGMAIMTLADPASPTIIGSLATGGNCYGVSSSGNHAFMADGTNGLVVVDISDPSDPVKIGHLDATTDPTFIGTCRHVAVQGDTLFVSSGSGGLYLVDVTDPTEPTVVGRKDTEGESTHVTLDGTVAWLSDGPEGLATFTADPNILDTTNNVAQSRDFSQTGEPLSRAKINASFTDSIMFELTCDGGLHWEEVSSGDDWHEFINTGSDLRWRMTLQQETEDQNPICDDLTITFERLHSYAEILTATDIPGDTGGQIRVVFGASRFDAPNQDETITEYSLYRRYDGAKTSAGNDDKSYPPGSWDFIGTIPADQEAEYATTIPTLADSSGTGLHFTAIFVRARTNTIGLFFDSPVDSAYSVNNLQPEPPTGFLVDSSPADGNLLTWDASPEQDFAHFRIYRALSAAILPQPSTLYHVTGETSFFDTTDGTWFYHLTVVDSDGHESEPVSYNAASPVPAVTVGRLQNYPNPFNPMTRIEFSVPAGGSKIKLEIYDFRGALIRVLQDGFLEEGIYQRQWDGTDATGRGMASGIYGCQLRGAGPVPSIKMTLVR